MPETRNRMIVNSIDSPPHRRAATEGARHANRAEEPIAWLHARGKISDRQFEELRRETTKKQEWGFLGNIVD